MHHEVEYLVSEGFEYDELRELLFGLVPDGFVDLMPGAPLYKKTRLYGAKGLVLVKGHYLTEVARAVEEEPDVHS